MLVCVNEGVGPAKSLDEQVRKVGVSAE